MKRALFIFISIVAYLSAFCQKEINNANNVIQLYNYAYISVEGKSFSKKLKVEVDLGDTPEQIKSGKEISDILTDKKSLAAILNYMSEQKFELVESRERTFSYQGTGGTNGVVLIMRKRMGPINSQ